VNNNGYNQLSQFVHYAQKRFDLPLLAGCFADARPQPDIPSRAVGLSLVLGEVVHVPSLLQLQAETKLPQWQRWVGYPVWSNWSNGHEFKGLRCEWEFIFRRKSGLI